MRQYRRVCRAALREAGRACRLPKLDAGRLDPLKVTLVDGPESFGYPTPLMDLSPRAEVIETESGIRDHPGRVWKLLRAMGVSCQRPIARAADRNEKAITEWKRKRWPP